MFPSQDSNELLFQEPSLFQKDLIFDDAFLEGSNLATGNTKTKQRRSKSSLQENNGEQTNESKLKKLMHRDIERQRRQEMANLLASLRSLLPLQYIKARSKSDHMQEAVNYIIHMQKNMKELKMRRDKLKKLSSNPSSTRAIATENGSSNSTGNSPNCVTISCFQDSVEILISCGLKEEEGFPLSKVLMELLETGLKVESCVSTKANDRFLHRIQSEANVLTCIDLSVLQQRLANIINLA
ncbi:hypothetical protein Pfo_027745 [Paulownia fortunei]|nr:hypothetical protein Pfo_027745 [Paulownia fortunei]